MTNQLHPEQRTFTLEQLKSYDGKAGRPAYVAYQGVVYDLSSSPEWEAGEHMATHYAGQDLTSALPDAPHDETVLIGMPVVGKLQT